MRKYPEGNGLSCCILLRCCCVLSLLQYFSTLTDLSLVFRLQSQYGVTALIGACKKGRLSTVQYLVAQGADINITDNVSGLSEELLPILLI